MLNSDTNGTATRRTVHLWRAGQGGLCPLLGPARAFGHSLATNRSRWRMCGFTPRIETDRISRAPFRRLHSERKRSTAVCSAVHSGRRRAV